MGVKTVIDSAKILYWQALSSTGTGNSVSRYQKMLQMQHQDYVLAPYLSATNTLGALDLSADPDVVAMVFMWIRVTLNLLDRK